MKKLSLCFIIALLSFACTSKKNITTTEKNTAPYFKATGNEPFWSLLLSEDTIVFHSLANDKTYTFPHTTAVKAMDANVKIYRTENPEAKMEIIIEQTECINDMSGDKSLYSVHLKLAFKNNTEEKYHGCGDYLLPTRFHDIWVLEMLNGKKVSVSDFAKQLPYFEINAKEKTYSGYGGCNGLGGTLFYEPGILRFERGMSTLMYCGDANKENELYQALNSVTQYTFNDNRLLLSNANGTLVVMKKTD